MFPENEYLYPAVADSSRLLVGCRREDYSASRIAMPLRTATLICSTSTSPRRSSSRPSTKARPMAPCPNPNSP